MIDTKKNSKSSLLGRSITVKECSDTGMAMVLICLLAGLFTENDQWFVGATVVLVVNMTWPRIYTLAAKGWLGFSELLGSVMSKVILSVVFFGVQTPIALLRRIFGHDPMKLGLWKKGTESVFETRDHSYASQDIEQPY